MLWGNVKSYFSTFLRLLDVTETTYAGKGGMIVQVNNAEDGLEFGVMPTGNANVQSDWEQTATGADDYIKNKPTIPGDVGDLTDTSDLLGDKNVQSDWEQTATGADDYIKNKPTITDELVKYDADDPTGGYLADKIIAGDNITISEGTGVNENKVQISVSGICDLIVTCPVIAQLLEQMEIVAGVVAGDNDISIPTVKYGLLYNSYVCDNTGISSSSEWTLPSYAMMTALNTHLGGSSTSGGHLKEASLDYWTVLSAGTDNSTKFNGRGAGQRLTSGSFSSIKQYHFFWLSDKLTSSRRSAHLINNADWGPSNVADAFATGESIRLCRPATGVADGTTGTYTGNNGRVYRTIVIDEIEYMADNLVETKFRDGTKIPEITDNTKWGNAVTAAMCAYNNDWDYV